MLLVEGGHPTWAHSSSESSDLVDSRLGKIASSEFEDGSVFFLL